jgi:hypothetical protein
VMFFGFRAFTDATGQEIPRSKNKQKCRTHYSGKRKRYTLKTQLTVNSKGLIVHKFCHVRGEVACMIMFSLSVVIQSCQIKFSQVFIWAILG